jgi:hypothetical protein
LCASNVALCSLYKGVCSLDCVHLVLLCVPFTKVPRSLVCVHLVLLCVPCPQDAEI